MKLHRCLKETTHRRTYNLLRKNLYAFCPYCKWHSSFWRSCGDKPFKYMFMVDDTGEIKNHYNWKLVSKNKKQWMKKCYTKVKTKYWKGGTITNYGW